MRYDVDGVAGIKPDDPFRVYDCNMNPIHGCTFCDTETGEVERPVEIPLVGRRKMTREFYPAPLKVVLLKPAAPMQRIIPIEPPTQTKLIKSNRGPQ